MNETARQESSDLIECPAAGENVVRLAIIAAMLIGLGLWCGYDHFIKGKYPYPDP